MTVCFALSSDHLPILISTTYRPYFQSLQDGCDFSECTGLHSRPALKRMKQTARREWTSASKNGSASLKRSQQRRPSFDDLPNFSTLYQPAELVVMAAGNHGVSLSEGPEER